jgi:hypothetical protein
VESGWKLKKFGMEENQERSKLDKAYERGEKGGRISGKAIKIMKENTLYK